MNKKATLLTTTAMVLCLGTSPVQASGNQENPLSLKSMARAGMITALSLGQTDALKAPGRFLAKPISRGGELNGWKEDAENFIATKFLQKPTDVELEFDPGLGYWAKRVFYAKLFKGAYDIDKKPFKNPINDAQESVLLKDIGLSLENIYTSSKVPPSEAESGRVFGTSLLRNLNRIFPIATKGLPQIPDNPDQILTLCFPSEFTEEVPAPIYPPVLKNNQDNLVGALSLMSPFANFIQKDSQGKYSIDLSDYEQYPVKEGLYRLGGKANLEYDWFSKQMKVRSIDYLGQRYSPKSPNFKTVQKVILATLFTDVANFRHFFNAHLISGAFCLTSNNYLEPSHPLRVLMRPHQFNTLNVNNNAAQLLIGDDAQAFPKLFSYDFQELIDLYNTKSRAFNIGSLDLRAEISRRNMNDPCISYPYRENAGKLWDIFANYVGKYVDHYYGKYTSEQEFIQNEPAIAQWHQALNKYIPNGVDGYTGGLSREAVKKLITTFSYTASVEHRSISFITYNYLLWFQDIPPFVRLDGKRPDIGTLQFYVNNDFGTESDFNKLTDDFSYLALDDAGREIMQSFTKAMRDYNTKLRAKGTDENQATLVPEEINTSVSS